MKTSTERRIVRDYFKNAKDETFIGKYKYSIVQRPPTNEWWIVRAKRYEENWEFYKKISPEVKI